MNIKELLKIFTGNRGSKGVAKERLRLVLIHDRSEVSPELLSLIKEEIVQVISKYMEIDEGTSEVNLHSSDGSAVLEANLIIKAVKRGRQDL